MEKYFTDFVAYLEELNSALQANEKARQMYYGFEIFDGPLRTKPDVLIVGINPGKGDKQREFHVEPFQSRMSYLDQLDREYHYHLAASMISLLEAGGFTQEQIRDNFENQWARMNLYPIITDRERDIKPCLNLLGRNKFSEFYGKCIIFLLDLVSFIRPKVVIFEGKGIYDEVVKEMLGLHNNWDNDAKIGHIFYEKTGTHFIAYKRFKSTVVSNKVVFGKLLRGLLES